MMASCTLERIKKDWRVLDKSDDEEPEDEEVREILSKWKKSAKKGLIEKKLKTDSTAPGLKDVNG